MPRLCDEGNYEADQKEVEKIKHLRGGGNPK